MKRFLPLISIFALFMLMLSGFAHAQTNRQAAPMQNTFSQPIPANANTAIL
ncbi:hypothetical protein [Nibribacter koreensis]|uniref:Uncharacterized protein n=1 Tax=Nibribacter koreensis TaxID=1084519 RepID=A0ABP8FKY8_9BACT